MFLVPVAAFLQIPAIILGLFGALFHSSLCLGTAGFFASLIELCTELLGSLIGGISYIPQFSNWALILCTIGMFILFLSILKKQTVSILLSSITIGISLISIIPFNNLPLQVTVIPVGQGDSSLAQLPSGENILIDAGGASFGDYDPGASIVVPTLQRLGVKTLDILVISHPDPDHLLGAFAVLDTFPVKEIWHSGFKDGHPLTERLYKKAQSKALPIKNARELLGHHRFGETIITILAPNTHTEAPYFKHLKANDNSLVVRITHEHKNLLWPGDLEKKGEELLLQEHEDLHADIVKAPHHGSQTSSTEAFIDRVNPRFVIYSTGPHNRFSFPHETIVERYRKRGVISFNTAVDGQIKIEISKDKIDIAGFSSSCKRISQNCA